MSTEDHEEEEGSGQGAASAELLRSYLAFAARAVRARLALTLGS